jgi:hypothetical protein
MSREHLGLIRHPAFESERCALHRTAGRGLNSTVHTREPKGRAGSDGSTSEAR